MQTEISPLFHLCVRNGESAIKIGTIISWTLKGTSTPKVLYCIDVRLLLRVRVRVRVCVCERERESYVVLRHQEQNVAQKISRH